jgi:hypothetical protein
MSESYRGFQSRRHFINSKLHGLSVKICGDRTVLDESIYRIIKNRPAATALWLDTIEPTGQVSTTMLTDSEATNLYNEMIRTLVKVQKNVSTAKTIVGEKDKSVMSVGQRKAIIKITKYDYRWSPEATFSFILTVLPEKRKRLSSWEVQNSKLLKLFTLITSKDADKIIKRLDKIKKRNSEKAGQ